jgi:hypothetical protein
LTIIDKDTSPAIGKKAAAFAQKDDFIFQAKTAR